jgi:hypothetical protein
MRAAHFPCGGRFHRCNLEPRLSGRLVLDGGKGSRRKSEYQRRLNKYAHQFSIEDYISLAITLKAEFWFAMRNERRSELIGTQPLGIEWCSSRELIDDHTSLTDELEYRNMIVSLCFFWLPRCA